MSPEHSALAVFATTALVLLLTPGPVVLHIVSAIHVALGLAAAFARECDPERAPAPLTTVTLSIGA